MAPILFGIGAQSALRAAAGLFGTAGSSQGRGSGDFGEMLTSLASSASQSIRDAENVSSAALRGKASAREVAETLMQAEQNLQTALAVRDKVVSALQEISRMPI